MKTMGNISILNCIILCFSVLSAHCQFWIDQEAQDRITDESLPLILKFLNDDVGAIINYNSGKIKHTRLKGDILEVDITATLTCKSPSEQCNYESADCRGLLFVKPNEQLQVISVDCNPNLPIEEPLALPIQDVHCEGCMVDINPNAKGVEELAKNVMQHIESEKGRKYSLIKILKIQREVTNGVNFVLTVLIGRPPHLCNPSVQECIRDSKEDMYCAVKFFQEPGYQSPKNIISNNCTQTQTFIPVFPEHQSNDINGVDTGKNRYEEKSFYPKQSEMSENDILKEIDAQIIPSNEFVPESTKNKAMLQPSPVKNMETSSANNLLDESSQSNIASSTFQEVLATEDHPISIVTDMAINQDENENSSSLTDTKLSSTSEPLQEKFLHQQNSDAEFNSQSSDLKEMHSATDNNSEAHRRERRGLVGGKKEIDVNNPNIKEYAEKGIDLLNTKLSRGDSLFRIGKILSATSQVVSGVSYDITAQVTDCQTDGNSIENCKNVPEICDINIWYRPWLNSRIITVKFGGGTYTVDDLKTNGRSKRDTLVGGWAQKGTDDPKAKIHLGNLLTKLDAQSGTGNKLEIKEILSVSTQVVAGTNWRIKALVSRSDAPQTECNFKFWEKLPDANRVRHLENVEIECDNPQLNYRSKRDILVRKPRQLLVGGYNPLPNDDSRIAKHVSHLLLTLDAQSGKDYKLKMKNVISASSQVVAGTNWDIKARVSLSDCKKSDEKLPESCGENEKSYETVCEFKFWERLPDKNGVRTLDNVRISCEDSSLSLRNKRQIELNSESEANVPGGQRFVNENEDEIKEFISESLRHMDEMSSHENKFTVLDFLSSTKQLVSGHLWRIKAVIVVSDCNKNDQTDWSRCGKLQGAEPKRCLITVWNRPWLENGRETNITCDNPTDVYFFKSGKSTKLDSPVVKHNVSHYDAFLDFEKTHRKSYSTPLERIRRYLIFRENMIYVELLNRNEQGTAVYGPTKFADLTREEFSKGLGYRSELRNENELSFMQADIPDIKLPDSFDWREKGAVAKVKDQGSCGSCWAFSVTGNVEGQYAIKYGKLLEFSEQELVDCDKLDQGCNGGLMDNAYRQIEKLGGLEEEKDYPYDARDETCHFNKGLIRVELADAVNISQDETEMAKWLVKNGPISIAINANAMQFYMGGVSHPWKVLCNPKNLDHGVLIVGYGVHTYPKFKKSLPYWIVKNSWGKSWGEQGYYRVYRGDGTCGVNQTPSSAILK